MPLCAASKTRGHRPCRKQGRWPAAMQPTTDIPDPATELVCTWHRHVVIDAQRPNACACCGRPWT